MRELLHKINEILNKKNNNNKAFILRYGNTTFEMNEQYPSPTITTDLSVSVKTFSNNSNCCEEFLYSLEELKKELICASEDINKLIYEYKEGK